MIEFVLILALILSLLAKIMSWLDGDDRDMAEYYRTEYHNEYLQRDRNDPNWWRHLN